MMFRLHNFGRQVASRQVRRNFPRQNPCRTPVARPPRATTSGTRQGRTRSAASQSAGRSASGLRRYQSVNVRESTPHGPRLTPRIRKPRSGHVRGFLGRRVEILLIAASVAWPQNAGQAGAVPEQRHLFSLLQAGSSPAQGSENYSAAPRRSACAALHCMNESAVSPSGSVASHADGYKAQLPEPLIT